jgi:hypothetical protein
MQTKALMLITFSKNSFFSSKRSILGGISLTNKHLLVLDGQGFHVTQEIIK